MHENFKKGDWVLVDNPHWKAQSGKEGKQRRKVRMVVGSGSDATLFFTDGSNSDSKYATKAGKNESIDEGKNDFVNEGKFMDFMRAVGDTLGGKLAEMTPKTTALNAYKSALIHGVDLSDKRIRNEIRTKILGPKAAVEFDKLVKLGPNDLFMKMGLPHVKKLKRKNG